MKPRISSCATLFLCGAVLLVTPGCQESAAPPGRDALAMNEDARACAKQLEGVHQAIQKFRRDHKDLPEWLTDLVPGYLADTNSLICPITKRTGQTHGFNALKDPKLPAAYLYEFSPLPMGSVWNGGQLRMRDFKRRQMGLVGGEVPIVRCHLHNPVLNLAFSGRIYGSRMNWEDNFADVVEPSAWTVQNLFPDIRRPEAAPPPPSLQPQRPPAEEPSPEELVGEPAPAFSLPLLDGGTFDLAAVRGKEIVLLDFWATWCGPCRVVMPTLVEVARAYADKGVRYYAVNLREEPEVVRKYLQSADLQIAVPMDKDGSVGKRYAVRAIPTMLLIDKEGVVQKVHIGASRELKAQLTGALDELLSGKQAGGTGPAPVPSAPIPARSADAAPGLVDLTGKFHAALTETWHPGDAGNDLAKLPAGIQEFQGVKFDVRGIIQLNGGGMVDMQGKPYPGRVAGIKVGAKCSRLHFLHSAGWAVPDGTVVGRYFLRYSDGSSRALPIVYGEDVRDWWVGSDQVVELKKASVAWQGQTSSGNGVRLYLRTWENPFPDRELASIDFVSTMTRCAPFLVAVTVEP